MCVFRKSGHDRFFWDEHRRNKKNMLTLKKSASAYHAGGTKKLAQFQRNQFTLVDKNKLSLFC
jgi:hypothetical protein